MSKQIELGSGMLVGLVGLILLASLLFTSLGASSPYVDPNRALPMFALISMAMIGVAAGAVIHYMTRYTTALIAVWASAAFLGTISLLSMLSIGLILLPVVLLSLVSATSGTIDHALSN